MINKINTEIKNAMLEKDASKRDVLRAVKSAAGLFAKEEHVELNDNHIIKAAQREIKTLRGTIVSLNGTNMEHSAIVEDAQYRIHILEDYLPVMLSEDAVKAEVAQILNGIENLTMGMAMKTVLSQLKGKADGKAISNAVGEYLKKMEVPNEL